MFICLRLGKYVLHSNTILFYVQNQIYISLVTMTTNPNRYTNIYYTFTPTRNIYKLRENEGNTSNHILYCNPQKIADTPSKIIVSELSELTTSFLSVCIYNFWQYMLLDMLIIQCIVSLACDVRLLQGMYGVQTDWLARYGDRAAHLYVWWNATRVIETPKTL